MKRLCIVFFIFVLFFISASSVYARQAKVVWVSDGDTLILKGREVVRLKGIDAPETRHEDERDQYYAREATLRLEELTMGRSVNLKLGQEPEDRFGRTLAYVYLPTGENVNILLVREGLAFYYPHGVQDRDISSKILDAQRRAMRNKEGFWEEILGMEKSGSEYVGNSRSLRFHTHKCGYGQKVAESNKVLFQNLYEAFYEGYAPCRRCTPWPLADD